MTADADKIRQDAYKAAANAVDKFLLRVGDPVVERLSEIGEGARDRFRAELGRVVDLNLDLVKQAFSLYGSPEAASAFGPEGSRASVSMAPTAPGSETGSIVWLHNYGDKPTKEVRLVGSRLRSDDGETLEPGVWSFEPATVDVPGRSAVPVLVRVLVPEDSACRRFAGSINPVGLDSMPIGIELDVIALEAIPHDSW